MRLFTCQGLLNPVYRNWKIDWKKYLILITNLNCIQFKTNCLTMTEHV